MSILSIIFSFGTFVAVIVCKPNNNGFVSFEVGCGGGTAKLSGDIAVVVVVV